MKVRSTQAMRWDIHLMAAMVMLGLGVSGTMAQTKSLSLSASRDNGLSSYYAGQNRGDDPGYCVGNGGFKADDAGRVLVGFDLSSIPTNSVILSATLCFAFQPNNASSPATLEVHRVTTSWTESGASWKFSDGTNAWTPGGDFSPAISSSTTSTFVGDSNTRVDFAFSNLVADVQAWVRQPGSNDGWLIKNSDETTQRPGPSALNVDKAMVSREYNKNNLDWAPTVEITYRKP
ncbi:MAG: DNRLRE domain-containing protein [Verrucomicrobia bacterium]|nr:DNRLRE domain-containing protein [Verrucomicrobiota bacterium]